MQCSGVFSVHTLQQGVTMALVDVAHMGYGLWPFRSWTALLYLAKSSLLRASKAWLRLKYLRNLAPRVHVSLFSVTKQQTVERVMGLKNTPEVMSAPQLQTGTNCSKKKNH